ncbi:hypothetical protein Taro_031122 [Colocasia esculenta]|uniref:Uncharacterized protein n=1 Tax=Colocasia esculenta TaxID=4460 RepID=A0A843W279_COLES|nr:hypothetical protein [Colocasia esculenta]
MRVATGSTEIATGSGTGRDSLIGSGLRLEELGKETLMDLPLHDFSPLLASPPGPETSWHKLGSAMRV